MLGRPLGRAAGARPIDVVGSGQVLGTGGVCTLDGDPTDTEYPQVA